MRRNKIFNQNLQKKKSASAIGKTSDKSKTKNSDVWDEGIGGKNSNGWHSNVQQSSYSSKTNSFNNSKQQQQQQNSWRYNKGNSHEVAWKTKGAWENQRFGQSRSRNSSVSESSWGINEESFPALGAEAPVPKVNVWAERKCKREEIKALEPRNEYDEEAMLRQALALSMIEANQEQERQRKLEEEYQLQMEALAVNPNAIHDSSETDLPLDIQKDSQFPSDLHIEEKFRKDSLKTHDISVISKDKRSNFKGSDPKFGKIIDSFGGWGLKERKHSTDSSEKLSYFLDDVIDKDLDVKLVTNDEEIFVEESKNSVSEAHLNGTYDLWTSSTLEGAKETFISCSWDSDKLYDEKGTFRDDLDNNKDEKNKDLDINYVDNKYIKSCEDLVTQSEILNETSTSSYVAINEKPEPLETEIHPKDNVDSILSSGEINEISSHIGQIKLNQSIENSYKSTIDELNVATDSFFSDSTTSSKVHNGNQWENISSTAEQAVNSFINESYSGINSLELKSPVNEICAENPLIPPPSAVESSHMESPHMSPQISQAPLILPHFNPVQNLMFPNAAMFPGNMHPMFGFPMDQVIVRQMLMLSNPFFASQLLAMEQYYRSLGMPVDSIITQPETVATHSHTSVPGMTSNPAEQNSFPNPLNCNGVLGMQDQSFQNKFSGNPSDFQSQNTVNVSHEEKQKKSQPPGFSNLDLSDNSSLVEIEEDEDWFRKYLPSDGSPPAIPPPQPPSLVHNKNGSMSAVSRELKPNQNTCNIEVDVHHNFSSKSPFDAHDVQKTCKPNPATTVKSESGGWSDPEDDCYKLPKYDDGWGTDNLPARSVKNSVVHENRKKPAYRQPSSQPRCKKWNV